MQRKANAVWQGGLKDGQGTVSTESGALAENRYSFAGRFEDGSGTNPEELVGASHAACFSMALSLVLGQSSIVADRIDTAATFTIEPTDEGFSVSAVHLQVSATIEDIDQAGFDSAIETTKTACPISNLLDTQITVDAKLEA